MPLTRKESMGPHLPNQVVSYCDYHEVPTSQNKMLFKTGSSLKRFFIFLDVYESSSGTWCDICNDALPWAARDLKESLDHIGEKEDWEKAHFLPCHLCFWLWVSLRLTPKSNGCIQKYQMFLRKCFSKPNIMLHFFGLTWSAYIHFNTKVFREW